MSRSICLYVWILAFHGYLVLFISFLVARRNRLVNTVTVLTGVGTLWVLSSVSLRLGVANDPFTWFILSETSLIMIPYLMYFVLYAITGEQSFNTGSFTLMVLLCVVLAIAFTVGFFRPEFISVSESGNSSFGVDHLYDVVLNPKPTAIILVISSTIVVGFCLHYLYTSPRMEFRGLLATGLVVYWVMNILYIYSGSYIPFELVGGIINGLILLYILKLRRILNFSSFVSHMLFPVFATFTVMVFCGLINAREWGRLAPYKQPILNVVMITSVVTSLVTLLFEFLYSRFFFDRGDYMLKCNSEYHEELLPRLGSIDDIAALFSSMMARIFGCTNFALYIIDEKTGDYVLRGESAYSKRIFSQHDPIVSHSKSLKGPQSAWNILGYVSDEGDDLKHAIESRELSVFCPLQVNGHVVGFYLMGGGRASTVDRIDRDALTSMNKTTAMALESTIMTHELEEEAVTDQLTGLFDRHTTRRYLNTFLEEKRGFVFLLFNIDDMKLFNTIYSISRGDDLLAVFAESLRAEADAKITLGRVSGKTFSAFVEGTREEALDYDSRVRKNFRFVNEGTIRSNMTFSTGMTVVVPGDERDDNALLDAVKVAEVQAKRHGKDQLCEYQAYMASDPEKYDTGMRIGTVDAISKALDLRDHFTYDHSDNVASYAKGIAEGIGLNPMECQVIYEAGLVHDIGKISIPDSVLLNPGKLTDEEYEIMKTHVIMSREVIKSLPNGFLMLPIAMAHHERWDGKGYPYGLKGEEIPIGGRCLAIADTFDAMTSKRIYRKAFSVEEALDEIERVSGTQLDPKLGPIFVKLVREGRIVPHPSL